MLNVSSLRYRYTQFFIFFIFCVTIYVMTQSVGSGIKTFQDNLYKKDFLIENASMIRIKIGDRVFPGGIVGEDGWMEYTGEGNIDDFQNAETLEHKILLVKELTNLQQYSKSQGITLLIVVAPNKASIYPDKLPKQIKFLPTQSRLDVLITYLEDNNLPIIVDIRPALKTARQDQDVYYKTDTHWNGYGAFVAYTTIINALGHSYPELKPYKSADMELVTTDPSIHDIPDLMQINFITEPSFLFKPKKAFVQTLQPGSYYGYNRFSWIPDSNLPTLLMFHDSFGNGFLNDYLTMNFRESHFIHLHGMKEYLNEDVIQQINPDIIIIEIAERNLEQLIEYLSNFAPSKGS